LKPGPIVGLQRGERSIGASELISPKQQVDRIEAHFRTRGALVSEYVVRYVFESGDSYEAVVRMVAGYQYVGLRETVEGLGEADQVHWWVRWTDFCPAHRAEPAATGLLWLSDRGPLESDERILAGTFEEDPRWSPAGHCIQRPGAARD
jgi:hypothetical protein